MPAAEKEEESMAVQGEPDGSLEHQGDVPPMVWLEWRWNDVDPEHHETAVHVYLLGRDISPVVDRAKPEGNNTDWTIVRRRRGS